VCPNPASWHRVDQALSHMGMTPTAVAGQRPDGFYAVCLGMIGVEAAIAFSEFVERYEVVVNAEDVLNRWTKVKDRVAEFTADNVGSLVEKLADHCKDNKWSEKQTKGVVKFSDTLGDEMLVHLWNKMVATQNVPNIQKLHKLLGSRVVAAVKESRNLK